MRKILLTFAVVFIITVFSLYSKAATTSATKCGSVTNLDIKSSANVICKYITDTNGTEYGVATAHIQGDREFGASSSTENIYYEDHTVGESSLDTDPTANGSFVSGWTKVGE